MKDSEFPYRCVHFKYHRATWRYDGGAPEEWSCRHPRGSGDCSEEHCPRAREGVEHGRSGVAYVVEAERV